LYCYLINIVYLKKLFMRVFLTGASGFIGSVIVKELLGAGHEVLGLARSEESAKAIEAAGATVHRGDLEDMDSLRKGAENADAVIHTGFIHDFSRFAEVCETDKRAIETIGEVLAGSSRPFVITSGTALVSPGTLALETVHPDAATGHHPRVASEIAADDVASRGVMVSVIRLSPSVHGDSDKGFVPMLIDLAKQKGTAGYIGGGLNRWTGVHKIDAARMFRLAMEKNTVAGQRFHAAESEGIYFKSIAESIGKHLNLPVVAVTSEKAAEHFGWFSHFAGLDAPVSTQITRDLLGWVPMQIGLLEDMEQGTYFKS
jgi:nucleoside-diphosphate-sugar epimerase